MATLIAHTRTYSIFPFYASRITLHQAHLAHATQHHQRALQCYAAAAHLDVAAGPTGGRSGGYVYVAARAGEAGLRLGLRALRRQQQRHSMQTPNPAFGSPMKGVKIEGPHNAQEEKADAELDAFVRQVAEECKRFHDNGTLTAIGKLLEAVMTAEIVKAKYVRSPFRPVSHSNVAAVQATTPFGSRYHISFLRQSPSCSRDCSYVVSLCPHRERSRRGHAQNRQAACCWYGRSACERRQRGRYLSW